MGKMGGGGIASVMGAVMIADGIGSLYTPRITCGRRVRVYPTEWLNEPDLGVT